MLKVQLQITEKGWKLKLIDVTVPVKPGEGTLKEESTFRNLDELLATIQSEPYSNDDIVALLLGDLRSLVEGVITSTYTSAKSVA